MWCLQLWPVSVKMTATITPELNPKLLCTAQKKSLSSVVYLLNLPQADTHQPLPHQHEPAAADSSSNSTKTASSSNRPVQHVLMLQEHWVKLLVFLVVTFVFCRVFVSENLGVVLAGAAVLGLGVYAALLAEVPQLGH